MSIEEGRREFSESFPCIFPLEQGISAETGSQQTATTARYKKIPLLRFFLYLMERAGFRALVAKGRRVRPKPQDKCVFRVEQGFA